MLGPTSLSSPINFICSSLKRSFEIRQGQKSVKCECCNIMVVSYLLVNTTSKAVCCPISSGIAYGLCTLAPETVCNIVSTNLCKFKEF